MKNLWTKYRQFLILLALGLFNLSLAARAANAAQEEQYKGVCATCTSPSGDFPCCVITACGGQGQPACGCQSSTGCGQN